MPSPEKKLFPNDKERETTAKFAYAKIYVMQ